MADEQWTLDQGVRNAEERTKLQVGNDLNVNYDHAKKVLNLAGRTGLPWEIIDENPDAVEEAVAKEDFDPDRWMKESPEFAAFAADNPIHLAVLKQDEDNLTWFEREWKRPLKLATGSTIAQVRLNQLQARRRSGRENWLEGDEAEIERLEDQIQTHNFGASGTFRPIIWAAKQLGPMGYTAAAGLDEAAAGAMLGYGAGIATGAVIGTAVAPGPGTVVGGATLGLVGYGIGGSTGYMLGSAEASFEMMSGEQYGRFIAAGFTHEEAAKVSGVTGAISAVPELVGIGKLLRGVPVIDDALNWGANQVAATMARDVLKKQTVGVASRRLAGRYGTNMGFEIFTEVVQDSVATLGQNYLAETYDKPDAHIDYDQWVDDMSNTVVETAKGVLLISAMGPGISYTQDLRRAKRSREMEATFRHLAESIEGSTTRTEAPESYRAFVEQVTEANGKILINANRWDEFWQGQNEDPDAMAERFGMDLGELEDARGPGHDVSIPPVAFAEQLAPSKLFDPILPDLKFHEDDMSPRERDLFDKNKPKIIQDIEASLEKLDEAESALDTENILREVGSQLIAAQMEETTSGHLAQLYRGFGVIADRLDMDATELFEKFFGGVRRVTPEALNRSEVLDPNIDPILNRLRRDDYPTDRQQRGATLMDLIDDSGGIDPADPELSAMDFELGALDLGISKAKMKRWRESGRMVSALAEIAAEQGYIPENNEAMLLEALGREIGGEPVFGINDQGQPGMQELNAQMEQVDRMITELDLDINEMSNEEVRGILEAADTYEQDLKGEELRQHIASLARIEESKQAADANEIDGLLARAESLFPLIYQEQDFSGIDLTDTVAIEGTENVVQITEDAQVKYDRAIRRKKALKALMDCVSG